VEKRRLEEENETQPTIGRGKRTRRREETETQEIDKSIRIRSSVDLTVPFSVESFLALFQCGEDCSSSEIECTDLFNAEKNQRRLLRTKFELKSNGAPEKVLLFLFSVQSVTDCSLDHICNPNTLLQVIRLFQKGMLFEVAIHILVVVRLCTS
jgi:hypothetical protein